MASSSSPRRDDGVAGTNARDEPTPTTREAQRRVGVLSLHNSKETKAILNAVRALGHEPVWLRDENVRSWIADGRVRVSPSIDVLVNRLLVTKSHRPLEDLQLAALFGETVPVVNPPEAVSNAIHKYRAGMTLACAGLPIPNAFFGRSVHTIDGWAERVRGTAVHKRTVGTNGTQMAVVDADESVAPAIAARQSFVQEYLETGGGRPSDIRVYVVGDRVVGAMRREAPNGEWRTNVALGGAVEDVSDDLGDEPRSIARRAVHTLGLDIGGVDLIRVDGDWHILEVNATAGFKGLYEATGLSPAPHIAALGIQRAGGAVPTDRVRELSGALDDSVPPCKPTIETPTADDEPLGYTTTVRLNGHDGITTRIAKSDTGAKRTSVDTGVAGDIGAGPVTGSTRVRSPSAKTVETRPLVELDLAINGVWRSVTVSLSDRSEMGYDVLLGRDVLTDYTLDVSTRVEE